MIRHITASAVVIDPNTRKILLVHHLASGKWMFPGGHVEENEAPHEAAMREVLEETGVVASILTVSQYLPDMQVQPRPWIVAEIPAPAKPARPGKPAEDAHSHIDFLYLATAVNPDPINALLSEVAEVCWASLWELGVLNTRAEVPILAPLALDQSL